MEKGSGTSLGQTPSFSEQCFWEPFTGRARPSLLSEALGSVLTRAVARGGRTSQPGGAA